MARALAAAMVLGSLLGAAAGAAVQGGLVLVTAQPVRLDGDLVAVARGGSIGLHEPVAEGAARIVGLVGVVTLVSWRAAFASPQVSMSTEDHRTTTYRVDGGTVEVVLAGEPFSFVAGVASEGALRVAGAVEVDGRPVRLEREVETVVGPRLSPFAAGDDVTLHWRAGWWFLQRYAYDGVAHEGFPLWERARLAAEGPMEAKFANGNVTFVDADGERRAFRLGRWVEEGVPGAPFGIERWQQLVVRGTVRDADVPLGDYWGLAAPEIVWNMEGAVEWREATGTGTVDGEAVSVDGADVEARGRFAVAPAQTGPTVGGFGDETYAVRGSFDSLTVDGAAAATPARPPLVRDASLVAVALAASALAAKLAVACYTRIRADRVLEHPTRRRMYEAVVAEPGLHARELQRRAGCAWGPFTFHLRILREGGFVRSERSGRYRVILPTTAQAGRPVATGGEVARAIVAALPEDGAAVPVRALRDRLGVSRGLLNYHLRRLAARGLVEVAEGHDGRHARRGAASR